MDSCDKGSLEEASVSASASSAGEEGKRSCVNCGTTKTPLWRGGPAGPKSLCNACGIRTRKKGRPVCAATNKVAIANKKSCKGSELGSSSLKQRFRVLRRQMLMKGWGDDRKFGEVEQAAVLLMALSCGSETNLISICS